MPRKRKLSNEEVEDESEEVENGVRTKRRAAVEARDRVVAREGASDDDDEEEDDEDDEDYECGDDAKDEDFDGKGAGDEEGDEEAEDDEEGDEENDEADVEGEDDDEEEADEEELESEPIDCILAELEEPTADAPGYVLKRKESPKKLEMCFMGEMRETLADISEAFTTHFEEKKLPVLHITKYDTIGDVKDTIQIDVLAFKYDKAYDIREMEEESDDILSQNFYSMVKVDGIDGIWATQYFLQED